jgi:hypothetical protein
MSEALHRKFSESFSLLICVKTDFQFGCKEKSCLWLGFSTSRRADQDMLPVLQLEIIKLGGHRQKDIYFKFKNVS